MKNTINDRFTFDYESGVNGSFLVANTSKEVNIVEFQVNMLAKNPNKHILPLDVRRNNDRINIYYNVTSKLSLSQYFKRSHLSKNEFIDIFLGIVKTLLNSKGFLLSDNSFVLDEEYIYINPDTMCISLMYLPVKLDIDITKALKDFAINLVVYSANISEEESDSFLQQFLSFLKKDTFSIIGFDSFLKEMKRTFRKQQETEPNKFLEISEEAQTSEKRDLQVNKEPVLKQNKLKVDIPKPKAVEIRNSKKVADTNTIKSKSKSSQSKENVKNESITNKLFTKPNIVIGIIIQAVIVLTVLVLLVSGKMDFLGDDIVTTALGLILVSAALSYFMWKNVLKIKIDTKSNLNKNSVDVNKVSQKPRNNIPIPKSDENQSKNRKIKNIEDKFSDKKISIPIENKRSDIKSGSSKQTINPNIEENNGQPIEEKKSVQVPIKSNVNETVFLGNATLRHPHLQIIKDSGIEDVVVDKPSFIIGRLDEQVDYVHSNNAIGKVHAEIITRVGCYYLKDLNSKNGTYINGKRIDSNKEYEIKNNDKITLANSEFVFIVL